MITRVPHHILATSEREPLPIFARAPRGEIAKAFDRLTVASTPLQITLKFQRVFADGTFCKNKWPATEVPLWELHF